MLERADYDFPGFGLPPGNVPGAAAPSTLVRGQGAFGAPGLGQFSLRPERGAIPGVTSGPKAIFGLGDGLVIKGSSGKFIEGLGSAVANILLTQFGPKPLEDRSKDGVVALSAGASAFLNFRAMLAIESTELQKIISAVIGVLMGTVAIGSVAGTLASDRARQQLRRSKAPAPAGAVAVLKKVSPF
jgi:hypothetical protein